MLAIYLSKYEACRKFLSRRPTYKGVNSFFIEDNSHRRNIRAGKILICFFFVLGCLGRLYEPDISVLIQDRDVFFPLVKGFLLILIGLNYFARNVLYDENKKQRKNFDIPTQEIMHVMFKTRWLVNGNDLISWAVNITTIATILCLAILIYI